MRKKCSLLILAVAAGLMLANNAVQACTSFIVTKGASANGSTYITYAADSHVLYGELYYKKAATYPAGAMLNIIDWDSGKKLGQIKQIAQTYSTVGNMNEHQLAITETTYGGNPSLVDTTGIMDYGSLIYITLQRAKNAREAIKTIAELMEEYGYYSSGESFSICDPNEVWIMEIIGKGAPVTDEKGKVVKGWTKGAVWVARRVPDGYVSGHANQARIQQFPLEGKQNPQSISSKNLKNIFKPEIECVYAHDVISFARLKPVSQEAVAKDGYAKTPKLFNGKDEEFSFSDIYAPVEFGGARFCDARVWAGFNHITTGMDKYIDYAMGKNLKNRMPLWVKPTKKLSFHDVAGLMRDHYENTPLDMTKDVGAGPFECPYRWRPMTWDLNGQAYIHERATSTQQTGFSLVAECRSTLPDPIGGILWFGLDDTYSTVYCPMYCGINSAPNCIAEGNGSMCEYSSTSAFWLFNQVTNFAYLRYNSMIKDIQKVQSELETTFGKDVLKMDEQAKAKWNNGQGEQEVRKMLTDFSHKEADVMFNRWKKLSEYLLVKYIDGNIKKEENGRFKESPYRKGQNVSPDMPRYPDWWYQLIINQHGNVIKDLSPAGSH